MQFLDWEELFYDPRLTDLFLLLKKVKSIIIDFTPSADFTDLR